MFELVSGTARADQIRDISIQDILGRQEVPPNPALMGACVTGRQVLVTGGGGSIGSELCRQILLLNPVALAVLDNSEANLYHITEELGPAVDAMADGQRPRFVPLLGSVTDERRVRAIFADNAIDTVFHAAAYKHVPIVEQQPELGVEVNVFGTQTVLDAAIDHGVGHFVLISTDKAVRPTNSMGASKRTAELILQARAAEVHGTRICMVRFGNVLGSSGSVVPKFKKQILAGGPITLTHPDITRFFMSIPEAAQLVLQAGAIAEGGEVFVLDMGDPVRIIDMARSMVNLYGKRLATETGDPLDIAIVVEGLRPGEKMYEELFISCDHRETGVAKVFTADETWMDRTVLQSRLDRLASFVAHGDSVSVRAELLKLAFAGQADGTVVRVRPLVRESPSFGVVAQEAS